MLEIDFLIGKDIEFLPGVEDYDSYVESGMRATIVSIKKYPEKGLYEFLFCYSKFESHNLNYETLRFINPVKNRYLTFRELNGYDETESYCVSHDFDSYRLLDDNVLREIILH